MAKDGTGQGSSEVADDEDAAATIANGLPRHSGLLQHAHLLQGSPVGNSSMPVGNESTDTAGVLAAHGLKVSAAEAGAGCVPKTASATLTGAFPNNR